MSKTKIVAKLAPSLLVAVFALSPFFVAEAASKPSIGGIIKKKSDNVTLEIKYGKLADKKVKVKVEITAVKTGKKTEKTYSDTLGSTGRADVKVKELKANTEYKFRIKVKRSNGGSYSSWSNSKKATTKG